MIGFGETEAADPFARRELGQIFRPLFIRAEGEDRMHDQRGLHRHGRTIAGIDPLDFAGNQSIGHVIGANAAEFLRDGRSEQAKLAHLAHDFAVEDFMAVGLGDAAHQFVLTIGARRIADHPLFVSQLIFQQKRIFPHEMRHPGAGLFGRCGVMVTHGCVLPGMAACFATIGTTALSPRKARRFRLFISFSILRR